MSEEAPSADQPADRSKRRRRPKQPSAPQDYLIDQQTGTLAGPGRPFNSQSPFVWGFFATTGGLLAFWLGSLLNGIASVLVLIVVALFLAIGLNPLVEWAMRRGARRPLAVLGVSILLVIAIGIFVATIAPIVAEQVQRIADNAPGWFEELQRNAWIQDLDARYDLVKRIENYVTDGGLAERVAGGALGVGLAVLSFLGNAFVVIVLTLYFLATLPVMKRALYQLAPASRRERVSVIGDRILGNVGGYVSGQFLVACIAGLSTLIFLFAVGLGEYAVALALVVAILDVIPMIGATIGAVVVCAIALATDWKVGIACIVFYVLYQQVENYFIYPRMMARSVNIPGALTVIAALIGASLLGVVGALLAIPTAASLLLLVREVFIPRQNER